jgi:hypothetical protein
MKEFTRARLFREECRIRDVYGCSPLAAKVWIRYASAFGQRCPPVAQTLELALAAGRSGMQNLHGEVCSATYNRRKKLTYHEREAREIIARDERGERWALMRKQA